MKRLCYVEREYGQFAYFGSDDVDGEDWHKPWWRDNAGEPYSKHDCIKVAWDGEFEFPGSDVSVNDINAGKRPWMKNEEARIFIYAGVTVDEFIRMVQQAGGDAYVRAERVLSRQWL